MPPTNQKLVSLSDARPQIVDGEMALPTGAGLGVELNEEVVERYRADAV